MIAERNPEVGKAVIKLRQMSADEKARDLYERRIKAQRDIVMHVDDRLFKVAKSFLDMGFPIEKISEGTGLTVEEIKGIK